MGDFVRVGARLEVDEMGTLPVLTLPRALDPYDIAVSLP